MANVCEVTIKIIGDRKSIKEAEKNKIDWPEKESRKKKKQSKEAEEEEEGRAEESMVTGYEGAFGVMMSIFFFFSLSFVFHFFMSCFCRV